MDSAANTRQADPHVNPALSTQEMELVARADERLAHAYEQIARADDELARFNEQISRLEKKPANVLRQPSRGRPALRGLMGLLLTAGICTAAFAWQSYGETVRPMISGWVPQLAAASSLPSETPKLADQQSPPAVQLAAVDAAVSQLPAPPIAAEQTQLLQTMARDLASVQQEIEQLKASQAELTRESARTAEQLKANQEQMARVIASASDQNLRPRTSAARSVATSANPPRPVANPARKPVPTAPATQARVQARAPVQLQSRQQ
jgi:septal ring factor EnvC (AmiA/AmiB activator)